MEKELIVERTANYVKEILGKEHTGHDWYHSERVWKLGKKIAAAEKAAVYVVELGALLHDIGDWKFHRGDEEVGPRMAGEWLVKNLVEYGIIKSVVDVVRGISYKGANAENKIKSLEGMCVQDADRLEAVGAIGIARCFAFGGSKGNVIYDPEVKPNVEMTVEQYKKANGTSINHFHEKLLLLKDKMNTKTGKILAQERHEFMEEFLERFLDEWNVK